MNDAWREETRLRLKASELYKVLSEKCESDDAGSQVLSLVDESSFYAYHRLKTVLKNMGEYTLHDGDHIFQVLRIMELILGKENLEQLSVPELMLLILSAFFHDIGMAPSEDDIIAWKKNWDAAPSLNEVEQKQYDQFKRYLAARPEKESQIRDYITERECSKSELLKGYLISDYIRETHSNRAREIIKADWNEKIKYQETDLTVEFADICFSHNSDALSLLNMDMQYLSGHGEFICLPLIGVILRLADILDFDTKRTPEVLLSNLTVRNPVSLVEWKKHRSVEAWIINKDLIQFHAKCRHPAIESAIHKFCDLIDNELSSCNNVLSEIKKSLLSIGKHLKLTLPYRTDRTKIETKKDIDGNPEYLFRETRFSLSKNQVVDLLMGTKLYGNPEVALRELLQNSIDACLLRQAMEKSWGNVFDPEIIVSYDGSKEESILEVIDNGIGMDQYVIDKYYTNIGNSFYKSADFYDLKAQSNADFSPTSRFGIGILSCFMISDTLIVDTRRVYEPHSSSSPLNLTVEGHDSIFWIKQGQRSTPGTTTKLVLRKSRNPWERLSEDDFIQAVENVVPNPPFKITIKANGISRVRDETSFKKIDVNSLKKHNWEEHENIKEIVFEIDDIENGIVASVIVGLLGSHGRPTQSINLNSRSIEIEGDSYQLEKSIYSSDNEIKQSSTSITIDEDGNIDTSSGDTTLAESVSKISLHGIEIPATLFPSFWEKRNIQVSISWPFPVLLVVDICGKRDIDLNSARNQIILNNKWIEFEDLLTIEILENIKQIVGNEYWSELKLILSNSKNERFTGSLRKMS